MPALFDFIYLISHDPASLRKQGLSVNMRLAEIYGWFTEGFDTKDLQEAKALLTELELLIS